ncbi:MAG: PEP-CTERM sorting domain-containing protein [Phycisphaerae bacterium]
MKKFAIILCVVVCLAGQTAWADMVKIIDFTEHGMEHAVDLSVGVNSYVGGELTYYGVNGTLMWHDEDDLTGMYYGSAWGGNSVHQHSVLWPTGGSYTLDGIDGAEVVVQINGGSDPDDLGIYDDLCLIVENDGTVYRSSVLAADPGLWDILAFTKDDLAAATWQEFDMLTASMVDGGSTASVEDFDDLTGMGVTVSPSSGNVFINNFDAWAVPEPATMSLLALGALAGMVRRRRR